MNIGNASRFLSLPQLLSLVFCNFHHRNLLYPCLHLFSILKILLILAGIPLKTEIQQYTSCKQMYSTKYTILFHPKTHAYHKYSNCWVIIHDFYF